MPEMCPEHCFVLENDVGRTVGYIVGTPNTNDWIKDYREKFIPWLESQGIHEAPPDADLNDQLTVAKRDLFTFRHYKPSAFPLANMMLEKYPASIHVNISAAYRRQGYGQKLLEAFGQSVKKNGASGISLVMAGNNTAGENFYTSCGFKRFPHVIDGGVSGELGRDNMVNMEVKTHVWLVKDLYERDQATL